MKLQDLTNYDWVDLTHTLHPGVPTWNGSCGFHQKMVLDYDSGLRVFKVDMHAGVGTHIDAPAHFKEGIGCDISEIPLKNCFGPLCVINLKNRTSPHLFVQIEDIENYEKNYGRIPEGAFVVADTGWARFWSQPEKYRNPDSNGKMNFPGFSSSSIDHLHQRNIHGIGIDTLSPDGSSDSFPVHQKILGEKKIILENLTNLDKVPLTGAYLFFLPPKIFEATEAVVRVVAFCPKHNH